MKRIEIFGGKIQLYRSPMSRFSSWAIRTPDNDVSATSARHSRV